MRRTPIRGAATVVLGAALVNITAALPWADAEVEPERVVAAQVGPAVVVPAPELVAEPTVVRATRSRPRSPLTPRELGRALAARAGWRGAQWSCLDKLWTRESLWRVTARNPRSGAYGIPQALPARRLAAAGPHWRTDAATQIRWGLTYVAARYDTPCGAWSFFRRHSYY